MQKKGYTLSSKDNGMRCYWQKRLRSWLDLIMKLSVVWKSTNIISDMTVGDYHYLVYYNELRSSGWGALLMTKDGNGYGHAFYCSYPDGQSLTQMPNELYTLLSSFRLLDQKNKITQ